MYMCKLVMCMLCEFICCPLVEVMFVDMLLDFGSYIVEFWLHTGANVPSTLSFSCSYIGL